MSFDAHTNAAHVRRTTVLVDALHRVYAMIADHAGPLPGLMDRGRSLLHLGVPPDLAVQQITRSQMALAAAPALPPAIGADLDLDLPLSDKAKGHLYLHLQTAMAAARLYGADLPQGPVRSLCFFCLCQDMAVSDLLRMAGLDPKVHTADALLPYASHALLHRLDRYLVRRLLVGFVHRDGLDAPQSRVAGGRVGGMFDGVAIHTTGHRAQQVFGNAPPSALSSNATQGRVAALHDSVYHA